MQTGACLVTAMTVAVFAPSAVLAGELPAWHIASLGATPDFQHGLLGTWKLNVVKSHSPEPLPYKRATRRIATSAGGGVTIVDDLVRTRGGILHLEWTGKFDGLDYPVQGVEVVLTNAYRCLDDRTCELTQKLDGEVVVTARLAISRDGRVLSTVTTDKTGSRTTTIYEKP